MTTVKNPDELRAFTRELAVDFLACGLDPERSVFFLQSAVPEVNELAWILSTVCPVSQLEKAHSYKDKIAHGFSPSHGLFAYPVLMAADILLYDSNLVPVGKDQKQHLEITRDLAQKINEAYGEGTLVVPEPMIRESTAVVPGLDGQKMSKSYHNTLPLFATADEAKKLVMKKLVTDATPLEAPKPKENSTLMALYRLMAGDAEVAAMEADYDRGGIGYGEFKKRLLEAYLGRFEAMSQRREEILADPGYVDGVLARGAEKARTAAAPVIDRVRRAVGLA
jgi:tryptophanyl-tRNA synthetase